MPDVIPTDIDACLSPMVIVDGFEHIKLSKPVTLTLPHPCPENYSRGIVHVFQLNNEEWKEITDDVRYTESKFSIALQIKHFSKFCGGYDVDEKELVIEENKNTDHTQQEPKIVIRFFTKSSSEQVDEQSTNSSSERVDNLANLTIFERQLKECTSLDPHSQDVYKMTSSPRGLIVIINMETFSDSSLPQRIGSEKDVEELEKLFGPEYLGFEVKIMKNLKGFDLWQNINPIFTNENNAYERFDSLAICLMSHGKEGRVVFAADGDEINVEEIFSKFSNTECAAFRYKPKLFIIQACRGIRGDPTQEQPPVVAFLAKSYPPVDKSDIIIANSSYEGYSSFRDKNNGCFFIQTLVKVFKEYADKEQVCEMLQRVTDKVNLRLQDGMTTRTQVPTVESTLTKKLYFWPRKKFKI